MVAPLAAPLVRTRWRLLHAGKKPWTTRFIPLHLPLPPDIDGHSPAGCAGPRSHIRTKRRFVCDKPSWCAFCYQRRNWETAALGLRDHLGLTSVHFSARPFAAQSLPDLLTARNQLRDWLTDLGFSRLMIGVHVYGEFLEEPKPHFDVLASGLEPDLSPFNNQWTLPPLRKWQQEFLRQHGGLGYSHTVLPDGWSRHAIASRHHAARYAMRSTIDVPRLLAGYDAPSAHFTILDLRGGSTRSSSLSTAALWRTVRHHEAVWRECPPWRTRLKRSEADRPRLARAQSIVAESFQGLSWRWRLENYGDQSPMSHTQKPPIQP